ncbi:hypothetical protein Enr13x_07100 [Stieleria neptunia]|uniref:Uncharacterized protein n=1 Tax=Stieleria neptunia TaxID=2527979 RepID=A0A518HJ45_9BACT|nr:hypothetical protein [Stieleria neptunia]QDV40874.1 hypothetical protein Enr13x_07100 [Stieleria neptunia]
MRQVTHGSADQSVYLQFLDTDGLALNPVPTSASTGIEIWYRRQGGLKVTLALSDLSAVDDAHSDGGMLHISDGIVRVDVPDAAFAAGASEVLFGGSIDGGVVVKETIGLIGHDNQSVYVPSIASNMRGTDGAALAAEWTATRAAYIDHLSAGPIATQASVDNIQNSVRSSLVVPKEYPLPESGTQRFRIDLMIYSRDDVGMEDPDGNLVTISAKNAAGVDRSGNLYTAATGGFPTSFMARDGVGQFHAYYEVDSADPVEQLNFKVDFSEGGNPMVDGNSTVIVAVPGGDGTTVSGFDIAALKQLFNVNVDETAIAGSVVQASQGAAGGDVSVDSFTASALQQLSAVKVVLMSLLDPKSKTLVLVQNKDYTSTSAIGPVRIQITQASVSKSDTVRLGWTLSSGETGEATGTVVDDAGTLYGEVELTKESHTNLPADNYGKYEFEHINGSGEVSPLLADQRLIILASHPN